MVNNLSVIDTIVVLVYIAGIFGVGMYAWCLQRRKKSKQAESYFLASRDVKWLAVAATLFSSNIGAEHFVGLAGSAAKSGIAVGAYEWTAPILLWILAYFVSPVYIKANIVTTPEYLEYRFNRIVRVYNAFITLVVYIFVVISSTLYAGAVILNTILGWSLYVSSFSLILATGCYVILGGLRAVVYTENVQTVILIVGGLLLMAFSLHEVGGLTGIYDKYPDISTECDGTEKLVIIKSYREDYMNLFRKAKDADWPWPGITFGIITMSYYYWCGNHLLIQRVLSSKSQLHAKYGAISASFLKILPVWMMCIPGICAVLLYPSKFCNQSASEYDSAYPMMVLNVLPKGLVGLVVAAMLSALMSSLAAVYNSAATIITNDIYKLLFARTRLSDQKLVLIGRISACVFVCISLLWLPMIQSGTSELFTYTQKVSAFIQNPLAVVYFLGTFWDRANVYGAYAAITIGFIAGFTRFIMTFGADDYCETIWFCHVNFLYFGMMLLGVCVLSMVVVSLVTPAPPKEKVSGLTYWSIVKRKEKRMKSGDDKEDKSTALLSGDGYQGSDIEQHSYDGNKSVDMEQVEMHRTSSVAYPEISKSRNLSNVSNPTPLEDEEDDESEIQQSLQPTKQSQAGEILVSKSNTDYSEYKEEELEDVEEHKCGCCWNLIHLKGDINNPKWNRIANVLTVISMMAVLSMFIWFR